MMMLSTERAKRFELKRPAGSLDEHKILARRLREARCAAGLTQSRMAELSGLNRTYISHLEQGRANPNLLEIVRLARVVEKSVSDLLRG